MSQVGPMLTLAKQDPQNHVVICTVRSEDSFINVVQNNDAPNSTNPPTFISPKGSMQNALNKALFTHFEDTQ